MLKNKMNCTRREFVKELFEFFIKFNITGLNVNFENQKELEKRIDKIYLLFTELLEWNKKINLTNITNPSDFIRKHVIDSAYLLKIIPYYRKGGYSLIDAGSGAGFPGLIVSILRDDVKIISIESVSKKCFFQKAVARKLGLQNFVCKNANFYSLKDEFGNVSGIVTRAAFDFKELTRFIDFLPIKHPLILYFFLSGKNLVNKIELTYKISNYNYKNKKLFTDRILFCKSDYIYEDNFKTISSFLVESLE